VEFVLEPTDGRRVEQPPQPSRYNLRMAPAPQRALSASGTPNLRKATPAQQQQQQQPTGPRPPTPPPNATSTLDIKAVPIHPSTDEPLTSMNLESLPSKPWRNPGADVTDYFNYGFDEFTWTAYCQKQDSVRAEFDPKKMMDEMMMMGTMMDPSAMMAMMGGAGGAGGGGPGAPGANGMPPEMAMMAAAGMANMPNMPGMPGMPPGFGMDAMGGVGPVGPGQGMDMSQQQQQQMYAMQNQQQQQQHGGMGQYGPNMGQGGYDEQQRYMQQQQQRMLVSLLSTSFLLSSSTLPL